MTQNRKCADVSPGIKCLFHNSLFRLAGACTIGAILILLSACASWHQRTLDYQNAVVSGNFEEADHLLQKDKKQARKKNQILYYMNRGYVDFMRGDYEASNQAFETAEILTEEQHKNLLTEAAVLISNPEVRPYRPEDFEVIMINFYKALNYLQINDMEGALVEARKINNKLNQLNDKYPDHKNRYQRDAFAHLLMGLIYDASGDYNNAFIAYRNAYDIYQTDYIRNFGVQAPKQLKQDLLRTAYKCGFTTELHQYEQEFNLSYTPGKETEEGQLIFFWLNGFGPVKAEWDISFIKQDNGGGAVVFYNDELGLSFPFFIPADYSDNEKQSLANLKTLRMAFPKYVERPPYFNYAVISLNGRSYSLEMAENINEIAFKTLNDRMMREFANSLLRAATKKTIEYTVREENQWAGFFVGLLNSATEQADTRNWQTLPYSISYSRIPLGPEENHLNIHFSSSRGASQDQQIRLEGGSRKTRFYIYHTMTR